MGPVAHDGGDDTGGGVDAPDGLVTCVEDIQIVFGVDGQANALERSEEIELSRSGRATVAE